MSTTEKAHWTTQCVGRFLIDLPSDAEYVGGSYDYDFATVERQSMEYEKFKKEVDAVEKHLKDVKHKSGTSLLLKKTALDENTRTLGYWEASYQYVAVDISGYRWLNGTRYLLHKLADPDKMEKAVAQMDTKMSTLQAKEKTVPTIRGFCIENAIFADNGSSDNESLNVRFRLKTRTDIVIDIATNLNNDAIPDSLLSRKPSVLSALGILGSTLGGVRNIKEGNRTIGAHPGQEWLLKAPNDHGQKAHLFTWEAPGLLGDELHPQIRIDIQSGNSDGGLDPKPISVTDEEMLELWDKILNSLRLRPTDDGKGNAAGDKKPPPNSAAAVLPLGELARTGTACPQTGYWQCPENDLHGSTRLFQIGHVMPAAFIKRDLSFLERVKGTSDQYSTNTVWRLVRYDEATQRLLATPPANGATDQPSIDT
jgi:hypothetical protein